MQRDFSRLERQDLDLLVIGGGVYGAWTAYDAALRGLRVALIERTDWAAGTSSASSKLIHGGLRYLQRVQLSLVRTSLRERRRLARLAPHQVRPLRFVIPVYRGAPVGTVRWKLGLTLYDTLAGRDQPVAPHATLSAPVVAKSYPFLSTSGLRGAFSYGDCGMDDARFTLEIVDGAAAAGAVVVNRAEALGFLRAGPRIIGAVVHDGEGGETRDVKASVTVDCGGAWGAEMRARDHLTRTRARVTKGVHLVMPGLPTAEAFLLLSPVDGRVCFLIPWYGRTLLGTTDTPYVGPADSVGVDDADVDYLLAVANTFIRPAWRKSDICGSFAGLRVLQDEPGEPSSVSREWSLAQPAPGLLTAVGGKYTTARDDAATAVDRAMVLTGRAAGDRPTAERRLPWAPLESLAEWLDRAVVEGVSRGLDSQTARTVALRFGVGVADIHGRVSRRPELARRLHPAFPFCRAEVERAVDEEMALSLDDVLRRRVPLTILTILSAEVAQDAAALAGSRLGWSAERRRAEVAGIAVSTFRAGGDGA